MRPYQYGQSYVNPRYSYSSQKIPPAPQRYPQDIQCVLVSQDRSKGSIFISNVEAAENELTLDKFQIGAVMTCARGYDRNIRKSRLQMYEYFPFDDKESCAIAPYFHQGADFIAKALQKTNILVHCIAGVSRSVSMVLAYLIRDKGMSYEQAYSHVKSHRKIIHPNEGFIQQLKKFAIEVSDKKSRYSKSPQITKHQHTYTPTKRLVSANQHYRNSHTIEHARTSDFGNFISRKDITNGEEFEQRSDKNYHKSSFQHDVTNSNEPLKHKKEEHVKRSTRNNSTHVIKSSTFLDVSRSKTPQKQQMQKETGLKQQAFAKHTKYYQTKNEQLNEKIKAIHQKYEKQRQELTPKRQNYYANHTYSPPRRPYANIQVQTEMTAKPRTYSYEDESHMDFRGKGYNFIRQEHVRGKTFSFTDNQNKRLLRCGNFPHRKQVSNNYRIVYQDYGSKYNPYQKNEIKYVGFQNNDVNTRKLKHEVAGRIRKNHNFGLLGRPLY